MTNPTFSNLDDVEKYIDIYGTKKTSVLRNKVINSPIHLVNKIKCYSYNYKSKQLNEYKKFDHLLKFKEELIKNNNEVNYKFYGVNVYPNIINFFTDDRNRESKILILKINDNVGEFIKHFEEIGFSTLRKTSFNKIILLNIGTEDVNNVLLLASLQFNIDSEYDLISLDKNKIIIY